MTFAPHSNDHVTRWNDLPVVAGQFAEKDAGQWFEYADRCDADGWAPELPHLVYVTHGTRFARVLKTVAYVAVDEAPDGTPVLEKWHLKGHNVYQNDTRDAAAAEVAAR